MSDERRNGYNTMTEDIAVLKANSVNVMQTLEKHTDCISGLEKQGVCVITTLNNIDKTLNELNSDRKLEAEKQEKLVLKVSSNTFQIKIIWGAVVSAVSGGSIYIWKLIIGLGA